MKDKTTIIPIASGKGGVGKSVFAASLSIALARMGHLTIAVDLDLGGSNLYSCLGIPNKYPGIGDFLKAKTVRFHELIVPTSVPKLKFIPGDGRTPFMANLSYDQRIELINEIKKIKARYVILDLGAGTVFNTLNFFGLSRTGMMVTTFEPMSVMNCIMFLRNFMLRILSSSVRSDNDILKMLIRSFKTPQSRQPVTIKSLMEMIRKRDPGLAEKAKAVCKRYRPRIIFNMGDHPDELKMLPKLDATIKKGISMEADYFGFIFYDDKVRRSTKNREIFLNKYPGSIAARMMAAIASKVSNIWDKPMENSMITLMAEAERWHEKRKKGI